MTPLTCTVRSPWPRPWVWSRAVDGPGFSHWSGYDTTDLDHGLMPGDELDVMTTLGGRRVAATVTVLDAIESSVLVLRTEAGLATTLEQLVLRPAPHGSELTYTVRPGSLLAAPFLADWLPHRVDEVGDRLASVLDVPASAVG